MIGFLTGKLHSTTNSTAIINVNGVGYEVYIPKNTLLTLINKKDDVSFEVYTHVNESTFQLYGFLTKQEKTVFQKLISVSGVGPKLALSVISELPLSDLLFAIANRDITTLTKISGVGKKTAERMAIELKDKFKDEIALSKIPAANDNPNNDLRLQDVTSALISLGYAELQAKKVVNGLSVDENDSVQTLIKKSLEALKN